MMKEYGVWIALAITMMLVYLVEKNEQEVVHIATKYPAEMVSKKTADKRINLVQRHNPFQLRGKVIDTPTNLFPLFTKNEEGLRYDEMPSVPETTVSPYVYAGKLLEDGEMVVFLTDGNKKYAVKAGDMIEEDWQVKFIHPTEIGLHYLPLNTQVSIQTGVLL